MPKKSDELEAASDRPTSPPSPDAMASPQHSALSDGSMSSGYLTPHSSVSGYSWLLDRPPRLSPNLPASLHEPASPHPSGSESSEIQLPAWYCTSSWHGDRTGGRLTPISRRTNLRLRTIYRRRRIGIPASRCLHHIRRRQTGRCLCAIFRHRKGRCFRMIQYRCLRTSQHSMAEVFDTGWVAALTFLTAN